MKVPGLGEVVKDKHFGWYYSTPVNVPMFDNKLCRIVLDGYDENQNKDAFHIAIKNFLAGSTDVLHAAEADLFRYYKDFEEFWIEEGRRPINTHGDVWQYVQFGNEAMVKRRSYGYKGVYISIECECEWEQEHGLQIVLKDGVRICKLGPYDGHLTNSDAYADDSLEYVIYKSWR